MSDPIKDLTFEEAVFLEGLAKGLGEVKVKPKGPSASQVSAAQAANREFQDRMKKVKDIAWKIRHHVSDRAVPRAEVKAILDDLRTKCYGPRASIGPESLAYLTGEIDEAIRTL